MTADTFTLIPFTGFGAPTNYVHFRFDLTFGDGDIPDWTIPKHIVVNEIPGSAKTIVHDMGNGRATATWRIFLYSRADLKRMMAYIGTEQSLFMIYGMQMLEGVEVSSNGMVYERLDSTLLMDVSNVTLKIGGTIECDATFSREVNLADLTATV